MRRRIMTNGSGLQRWIWMAVLFAASVATSVATVACDGGDDGSTGSGTDTGSDASADSAGADTGDPDGEDQDAEAPDADGGDLDANGDDIGSDASEADGAGPDAATDGDAAQSECGNGVVEDGEQCDDGQSPPANSDGCSSTCQVEPDWSCDESEPSTCALLCGNGVLDGAEECDDGQSPAVGGDGCSAACTVEAEWECDNSEPSACVTICGNGAIDEGEECDDSNSDPLDGCSPSCAIEAGWICNSDAPPSACATVCGDGIAAGDEECDDGDGESALVNGDGCDTECAVEEGWQCDEFSPSSCNAICGDGVILGEEQCDDGQSEPADGDGCSATCVVEGTWECAGEPSVCLFVDILTQGPGIAVALPTGIYNGMLATMACVPLTAEAVGTVNTVDSIKSVTLGLTHPRISDITVKLQSPAGTIVTLVSRPGLDEDFDNGAGSGGDNSNAESSYPITFTSDATVSAEDMGASIGTEGVICKDDLICDFVPNSGAAGGPTLDNLSGETVVGEWLLCVGDSYSFDTGSIDLVSLAIKRGPEPESAGP